MGRLSCLLILIVVLASLAVTYPALADVTGTVAFTDAREHPSA